MKKFWSDSSSLGKLSILIGLFVVAPLIVLPWYPEDAKYTLSFLLTAAVLFFWDCYSAFSVRKTRKFQRTGNLKWDVPV